MGSSKNAIRRKHSEISHECSHCGVEFTSRSAKSMYCGASCRDKARYLRDKEKRILAAREYREANSDKIRESNARRWREDTELGKRRNRESYEKNRKKRIAQAIAYQKAHPEIVATTRHRRKAAQSYKIRPVDHRRTLARYRNQCAYCQSPLGTWGRAHSNSLQWDHVVPLSKGGVDSVGNIVPSCRDCNLSKSSKLLVEWRLKIV